MNEVLYWAEELKRRWMEKAAERDDTLCQTEGGAEECLRVPERRMEMEEKPTGEHPNS